MASTITSASIAAASGVSQGRIPVAAGTISPTPAEDLEDPDDAEIRRSDVPGPPRTRVRRKRLKPEGVGVTQDCEGQPEPDLEDP
jgi:hypothetical protein